MLNISKRVHIERETSASAILIFKKASTGYDETLFLMAVTDFQKRIVWYYFFKNFLVRTTTESKIISYLYRKIETLDFNLYRVLLGQQIEKVIIPTISQPR